LPIDFDMNRRFFCGNLDIDEEAGYDRIEFHSSNGVVAERHISTPLGDPDGLRRGQRGGVRARREPYLLWL
jgi:hypothetical protein